MTSCNVCSYWPIVAFSIPCLEKFRVHHSLNIVCSLSYWSFQNDHEIWNFDMRVRITTNATYCSHAYQEVSSCILSHCFKKCRGSYTAITQLSVRGPYLYICVFKDRPYLWICNTVSMVCLCSQQLFRTVSSYMLSYDTLDKCYMNV